jgi:rhodanese-related sulfurtransferase
MSVAQWVADIEAGRVALIDVRPLHAYGAGHVAGSRNAPYSRHGWAMQVAQWARATGTRVALFADNGIVAKRAQSDLEQAGTAPEWVWDSGPQAWESQGGLLIRIAYTTVDGLKDHRERFVVVDVREPYEWRTGTVPGALRIPLGDLAARVPEMDRNNHYAIICAHGNRSQTGACYLADQGFSASSVVGGMALWLQAGYPVERS